MSKVDDIRAKLKAIVGVYGTAPAAGEAWGYVAYLLSELDATEAARVEAFEMARKFIVSDDPPSEEAMRYGREVVAPRLAAEVTPAVADGTSQPWTPPAGQDEVASSWQRSAEEAASQVERMRQERDSATMRLGAEIERLTRAAAHHLDLETIERERRHRAEKEAEKLLAERDEARLQLQREQEQGEQARKERNAALQREGKALRERDEAMKKMAEQKAFFDDCTRADKAMVRELIEQRDEARRQRDDAKAERDQYRDATAWEVTCLSCGGLLTKLRTQEERADAAEKALAQAHKAMAKVIDERDDALAAGQSEAHETLVHQVAQALGAPIGANLTHPTVGVVAKVKALIRQRDSGFACGRELIKERDAMRDRMREAERQLENEKQARYAAEAGQERARLARFERLLAKVVALQAALSSAHKRRREAEQSLVIQRTIAECLDKHLEAALEAEHAIADRVEGAEALAEHTRQNMTLVRAAAEDDRKRAAGLERTLSELRRSARAAFDGWRRGDDVGGPMFALDAMLKQIDAHEPPGLLPTPVETYRRALCFWGLVLGYEPGRQLNAMVYHVLGDARASLPPTLCHLASGGYPRLDGHPIGGPYRWSVPSIQRMIDAALAAVGATAKGSDGAEGSKGS